jgi:hypothetical protein
MKKLFKRYIIGFFVCLFYEGEHDYHRVSPFDINYNYLAECSRCGKTKIF